MTNNEMQLVVRMKADLLAAMKAKDTVRVATLRTMISALDNATAVQVDTSYVPMEGMTPDVPRREVSKDEQLSILAEEAEGRRKAYQQYQELGKTEEAERLRAELAVFADYLGNAE
jgi:uncharacterized protein YqeY